jgi:hypothetical protein
MIILYEIMAWLTILQLQGILTNISSLINL